MNYTILSTKQSELLEQLIVKHGQIITSQDIFSQAKESWDYQQTKNLITKLVKNGWLMRIKNGLYAISDLSNRGFLSLSFYTVAGLLVKDSYVSFESALQYYGMFDQLAGKTISVSLKKFKTVLLNNTEYSFIQTKEKLFFGFQEEIIDNKATRIATAEKALIDIINFRKSKYAVDLVIEKLAEHKHSLDLARLAEYLKEFSQATIKTFGFIFDLLKIDSVDIYRLAENSIKIKHSTHRMLLGDKKFNAKWRLYYDEHFDKYDK
ncbi:MAG: type IV toxin-antitoxin system AbiEi family antitoxin domain-containing protein [bacterium]